MLEQDFSKRLVMVVRKDLPGWQAMNVATHIAAFIGNNLGIAFNTGEFFLTKDAKNYPRNSQYPFIIKSAHSSEQLHTVLNKARDANLLHHACIREMLDTTDDADIVGILAEKNDADIELLGVGVLGSHEETSALTKKFGLWT